MVRVDGVDLVVERGADEQRVRLTTLRAAAAFVGVGPGMPPSVYTPATPLDLDQPLAIDPPAATALADWFARVDRALRTFADELRDAGAGEPSPITIWPEHFDLARSAAKVNYGASPGDDAIGEPYAYVGPWDRPLPGDSAFWNQPFGATLGHERIASSDDLVAFYRAGKEAAGRR